MQCPACQNEARKFGKDRDGNQRFQCQTCRKLFAERPARLLGDMRIDLDKALQVLKLLVEGMSVRATIRCSGVNRTTILNLMTFVGANCERLLEKRCNKLPVDDVQVDEVWGFVGMKDKTRRRFYEDLDD